MADLISKQDAIRWVKTECNPYGKPTLDFESGVKVIKHLKLMPSIEPEQRWIPFKTRPLTEEEKEKYPDWEFIFDGELPDDGQRILVNIKHRGHEAVQIDCFHCDDDCFLESGYEFVTEATAWMPLPEPYREEVKGGNGNEMC